MPFPRKLLNDAEDVVLDLHPHWWYMARQAALLFVAVVIGIMVLSSDLPGLVDIAAGLLILGSLGWFGYRYLDWVTTNFVVTTDRLIYRNGVLSKVGVEIPLDRVNTVHFSQTIFERLLRAGDLLIESAGEKGSQAFSDVRRPSAVQNEIYKQIEANENRKFDRIGAGGSQLSVAEQLEKLSALREKGDLTEDEFQHEKRRLLGDG